MEVGLHERESSRKHSQEGPGERCLLSALPLPHPTSSGPAGERPLPGALAASQWGVSHFMPQGPHRALETLTDVLCKDDARQAGGLGQAGLHHRLLGALPLIWDHWLYAGHLRPGR